MSSNDKKHSRKHKKGALGAVDLSEKLPLTKYEKKLGALQEALRKIQQAYLFSGDSAVLVFEGWDAAGKGGVIRRITSWLDPRSVRVWPIAAPRQYYKERHYLSRFWERLPPNGAISIFDRSWYGRVLVERVEGFANEAEWRRAYREINEFEHLIHNDGARVLKYFLHISPEEQLKRFRKRLEDPLKRWKLSYEDFRNRDKWAAYEDAIEEMVEKTSTDHAPWRLIPANDKKFARVAIMEDVVDRLSKGVDLGPAPIEERTLEAARHVFDLEPDLLARLSAAGLRRDRA